MDPRIKAFIESFVFLVRGTDGSDLSAGAQKQLRDGAIFMNNRLKAGAKPVLTSEQMKKLIVWATE